MVSTEKRKEEHLDICLTKDVEYKKKTGFEKIELVHNALPSIAFEKIDTSSTFLNKKINFPILISSMTGGCKRAKKINRDLAKFANDKRIMFSVGSMRAMIEDKKLTETYSVRDVAKDIVFLGNVGIGQLRTYETAQIMQAMDSLEVDGFFVHLNSAQELLQMKGDNNWEGNYQRLIDLCKESKYPVLVKEVGAGISKDVAKKLNLLNIYGIDIAGAGGTSWTKVDYLRTKKGRIFSEWGIPTMSSLMEVRGLTPKKVISSGGIRDGIDIAKSIALGADACGLALPFLKAHNDKKLNKFFDDLTFELKAAMFLTNSKNLQDLKGAKIHGL